MFHDETGFLIGDAQDLFVRKNATDFWARANRTGGRPNLHVGEHHVGAPNIMFHDCFFVFRFFNCLFLRFSVTLT
jgi:hypothetical protein